MIADRMRMCQNKKLYNFSTPVQITGNQLTTQNNIIRLSNGWLVAAVIHDSLFYTYFYKSVNNGASWSQMCYSSYKTSSVNICSVGTVVYMVMTNADTSVVKFYSFDATTVTNTEKSASFTTVFSGYTVGSCSIARDTAGKVHIIWNSYTSTYASNYNICYSYTTNGGTTWLKANGTVGFDFVTNEMNTNQFYSPILVTTASSVIVACFSTNNSNSSSVWTARLNGGVWGSLVQVYVVSHSSPVYQQASLSMCVSKNGQIHLAWIGKDAQYYNYDNVRYSKSTDDGVTWSAMLNIMTNNTWPLWSGTSICSDKNNDIYILFAGYWTGTPTTYNILMLKCTGGTWNTTPTQLTSTVDNTWFPQACHEFDDFTTPVMMYTISALFVKFIGVFNA